ncbi:hypothetical protein Y032_0356g3355 [Ancylostoma ceylanicum]|uniref:Phlebovirus glycoprotein G2 fusion domain-containing protein n=1 Tax=Ancylostoma ceylanicum TaxID=53326 RepID=A0A016RW82_9BILA|nr:hypothetical protein Y032_0356g3355 [Ancylostoma ceylanicum]
MGRIKELVTNSEGIVREAIITLPSHRQIRRPVNLLVPMELDDNPSCSNREDESISQDKSTSLGNIQAIPTDDKSDGGQSKHNEQRTSRYNLRQRRQVNYKEFLTVSQITTALAVLLTVVVFGETAQTTPLSAIAPMRDYVEARNIRCIKGGVELASINQISYEVCAEEFCTIYESPQAKETVRFPAQVVLHEHQVQWKFVNDESVKTIVTTCPAAPFCEHIDCTFCSAVIFNPECWPFKAIFATTILLYFVITGCYVFLYVPLTLGTP